MLIKWVNQDVLKTLPLSKQELKEAESDNTTHLVIKFDWKKRNIVFC